MVTKEPGGLNLTTTTVYQESENAKKEKESTGAVVETRSPEGSDSHLPPAPIYAAQIGSYGWENGQLSYPSDDAVDAHGNVWVADHGNDRVEEFSAAGAFIAAYGSKGAGGGPFSGPGGVAVNKTSGDVYVTDSGNSRVEELSPEGKFWRHLALG